MILFDLHCSQSHAFEAWFRDSGSFDRLAAVGEIQCPVCGDTGIKKALMAPNISTSKTAERQARQAEESATKEVPAPPDGEGGAEQPAATPKPPSVTVQENSGQVGGNTGMPVPEKVAEAMRVLRQVQTHIEKNFDHVGKRFAEEARKMHYGEAEKRSIYGQATKDEAEELIDEGIDVDQMPWLPSRDS
jgi:hypothetical protein